MVWNLRTDLKDWYKSIVINKNSYLIFGAETKGLPQEITSKFKENLYKFPMYSEHIRSINLSNIATAAAYEAVRQINFS